MLMRDDVAECGEGWHFKDASTVELCPDTCARLQDGISRIEVLLACVPSSR